MNKVFYIKKVPNVFDYEEVRVDDRKRKRERKKKLDGELRISRMEIVRNVSSLLQYSFLSLLQVGYFRIDMLNNWRWREMPFSSLFSMPIFITFFNARTITAYHK